MSVCGRRAIAALAILTTFTPSVAAASARDAVDPTVAVDRTGTTAGEELLITGTDWPAGSSLIVELCGHGGIAGSRDCDLPHQRTAGVGTSGTFSVALTTGLPPRPCPCVIRVTDQATDISATAPIAVAGVATVPITEAGGGPERSVEVSRIAVVGAPKIGELFGLGGRRVLEVTLVNTGAVPVEAPELSIVWGTGDDPVGFVPPPETKPLDPGETQTLTVALDRPPMTLGEQTAVATVQGFGQTIVARDSISSYPWGLLAIALLLLQVMMLKLRNRYRRRRERRVGREDQPSRPVLALPVATPALGRGEPSGDDAAAAPEVIDLTTIESGVREPAGEAPRLVLGVVPTDVHVAPVQELEAEAEDSRFKARLALRHATELSEALVAAAGVRLEELEDRAAARLREAERNQAEAMQVLEAAKAQADAVVRRASAAADLIRWEASAERGAAREALEALEVQRREVLAMAEEAAARVQVEFDRARVLVPPRPPSPQLAPRLGGLEQRLAHAVSQALASPVD